MSLRRGRLRVRLCKRANTYAARRRDLLVLFCYAPSWVHLLPLAQGRYGW